jgi:hypothetical protein
MARLEQPKNIGDVIRNLDQIIEWSIKAESHIGYFTVIYKRVTVAIREAINQGVFDNGSRIEQLDVAFGRRYFNALNAYFERDSSQGLTLPWAVAFVGDQDDQAIILQYMLAGLNAHITFDLGLGLLAVAGNLDERLPARRRPALLADPRNCQRHRPAFPRASSDSLADAGRGRCPEGGADEIT